VETFYCKTNIIKGDAAKVLQSLAAKSLLLVTDPFFLENGTARRLVSESKAARTRIFSDVIPDPTVELAAKGTAVVKEFAPDTVVALGGGSAMDCAKAMAYFYPEPVRLVAIPTTSGSGSEVTDFAVLTHGNTKHPLVDKKVCPDVAILDEKLLAELPKSLIADSGFDVLCHALEGYVATKAGGITDALAKEAFVSHLPICLRLMREIRRCGVRSTWRPPWRVWPFPRQAWDCVMPWPTAWAACSMCPTDGSMRF